MAPGVLRKTLIDSLRATLAPRQYLRALGFDPYPWQDWVLDQSLRRVLLNCCRQAGKSTVIAAKAAHKAKFFPGSLILLISPSERQSKELMRKVEAFYERDPGFPEERENNQLTKTFSNRSRIIALPGSEKTIRGYSGPTLIIIDEASRVQDELYMAIRPMMGGADTELVMMTTPFGKRGAFYRAWAESERWEKIEVIGKDILGRYRDEEDYRQQMAEKGIKAWYSPRHDPFFLREELDEMGEWWYKQEYGGEFLDAVDAVFNRDDIIGSLVDEPAISFPVMVDETVGVMEFD